MTVYLDERGYTITTDELRAEYEELKATGETEAYSFAAYLRNCTSKNGSLQKYERED